MKAGLDAQGKLVALHTRIACPSILKVLMPGALKGGIDFTAVRAFNDMPYVVANQQVDYALRNGHVPVGFWRAPGQQNSFYRECVRRRVGGRRGSGSTRLSAWRC
jgi:isoquinoline 1-oxidoreductase beta subunit